MVLLRMEATSCRLPGHRLPLQPIMQITFYRRARGMQARLTCAAGWRHAGPAQGCHSCLPGCCGWCCCAWRPYHAGYLVTGCLCSLPCKSLFTDELRACRPVSHALLDGGAQARPQAAIAACLAAVDGAAAHGGHIMQATWSQAAFAAYHANHFLQTSSGHAGQAHMRCCMAARRSGPRLP